MCSDRNAQLPRQLEACLKVDFGQLPHFRRNTVELGIVSTPEPGIVAVCADGRKLDPVWRLPRAGQRIDYGLRVHKVDVSGNFLYPLDKISDLDRSGSGTTLRWNVIPRQNLIFVADVTIPTDLPGGSIPLVLRGHVTHILADFYARAHSTRPARL